MKLLILLALMIPACKSLPPKQSPPAKHTEDARLKIASPIPDGVPKVIPRKHGFLPSVFVTGWHNTLWMHAADDKNSRVVEELADACSNTYLHMFWIEIDYTKKVYEIWGQAKYLLDLNQPREDVVTNTSTGGIYDWMWPVIWHEAKPCYKPQAEAPHQAKAPPVGAGTLLGTEIWGNSIIQESTGICSSNIASASGSVIITFDNGSRTGKIETVEPTTSTGDRPHFTSHQESAPPKN